MRFWNAVETIPGPAAVRAEWSFYLENEPFEQVLPLLRPKLEFSKGYPRIQAGQFVGGYAVAQFGRDDFVGVDEYGADVIPLTRNDVIAWELDKARLVRELATAFGLKPASTADVELPHGVLPVGRFVPVAGYEFSVFMAVERDAQRLTGTVGLLVGTTEAPFLLFVPTARKITRAVQQIAEQRKLGIMPLCDVVTITENGLALTEAAQVQLQRFREAHVPLKETVRTGFFPTPAGTTWSQVRIRFVDGHTVSVRIGKVVERLTYIQLGMADRRNTRPTQQWLLLRTFAERRGTLRWGDRGADYRNKKRRERLNQELKDYFRISGDPIILTEDGKGWQTVFEIEPDAD